MLFNSAIFLVFISILLPLYALLRRDRSRKVLLLVASYAFYANWNYRYAPLLALSTLIDYFAGMRIGKTDNPRTRRVWLMASLVTNLGILCVFKYGNFFLDSLAPISGPLQLDVFRLPGQIPVGISFYTFQTLSYTIDVYRGRTQVTHSLLDFAVFVSFFPQLVAGPIVRSREFLPQIKKLQDLDWDRLGAGFQRCMLGLFKKVVIADNAGLFVNEIFGDPTGYSSLVLWSACVAFILQVYFDFAGYTDIALGLGRIFGLTFPENFDAPYLSRSITELWRRWHMSLTRWFRDYLYIPMGGLTRSLWKSSVRLIITFALIGLWHGASWHFVLFGLYQGTLVVLERVIGYGRGKVGPYNRTVREWAQTCLTLTLWIFGIPMFRCASVGEMGLYYSRMFSAGEWSGRPEIRGLMWIGALVCLVLVEHFARVLRARETVWDRTPGVVQGFAVASLIVLISLWRVDQVAFFYFQF